MAVPVTLSGVELLQAGSLYNMGSARVGPYKSSGGSFYGIFRDAGIDFRLVVMKATDPTDSWSSIATLTMPSNADLTHLAACQVDDILHIAVCLAATNTILYNTFNMATDAFVISNETTGITIASSDSDNKCGIIRRSDGVVVIEYNGAVDAI